MIAELAEIFKPMQISPKLMHWDYKNVNQYIQVAEAFSRTMHQCVYVVDRFRRSFLYVSDSQLILCGQSPQELKRSGYKFYQNHIPEKELDMLREINEAGARFYDGLPSGERLNYTISCDFHLIQPNKRMVLVNHKLTPLALDGQHNIWLALCVVTHSPNSEAGNAIITRKGQKQKNVLHYDFGIKEWVRQKKIRLTQRQKEILSLSARGITMNEIARELDISSDTVKLHKKNLFEKLGAKNMVEAIHFATSYNLFE